MGYSWQAVNIHINQHTRLAVLQRLLLQEWAAIPKKQKLATGEFDEEETQWVSSHCRVNLGGYTHY